MLIGSLFSGIGGLELGLERAGVGSTVWQCEIDPYARAVLAKHWPDAIRFDDITKMHYVPPVDLICGGFPCQDISNAGKRAGIEGSRSGLFYELMRVVRLVRPRFVVLENVAALLGRGMGDVLGELSESGYDAEWDCVPASAVGAPHQRDRVFIIGTQRTDADQERRATDAEHWKELARADDSRNRGAVDSDSDVADADCQRVRIEDRPNSRFQRRAPESPKPTSLRPCDGPTGVRHVGPSGAHVADADQGGQPRRSQHDAGWSAINGSECDGAQLADADHARLEGRHMRGNARSPRPAVVARRWAISRDWLPEPDVGRVAHGIPFRVDRLKCLGNAVVPACAEVVGRRLMEIASC